MTAVLSLRLIADDLTGALDSAASFACSSAPVSVLWEFAEVPDGPLALSTESREVSVTEARVRTAAAALALTRGAGDALVFKKIDSLLRGHPMPELAAVIEAMRPERVVIAPAHPALGRVTRGGRQYVRDPRTGEVARIGVDLAADLGALGFVTTGERDEGCEGPEILLIDVESEAQLGAAVMRERARGGRVLWCGSGGLAEALAGVSRRYLSVPPGRILMVVGSDHPVAAAQIRTLHNAAPGCVIPFGAKDAAEDLAASVEASIARCGVAVAAARLPNLLRKEAAGLIAERVAGLLSRVSQPDVLYASGGETLRAVCDALGAQGLSAEGFVGPGIPLSRVRAGRWAGSPVISKSGAFGDDMTLVRLLGLSGPSSSLP